MLRFAHWFSFVSLCVIYLWSFKNCLLNLLKDFLPLFEREIMEDYETVILIKQEIFVFQIPPRATNRGYRAADWKLHSPDWTGRMRIVSKGKKCFIKLEDKTTGELFAKAPIDKYPGIALEAVTDSSRYFVLRIEDDNGRAAFIGIGFADRGDSFDLNVSLQEHFKWLQTTEDIEKGTGEASENKPNLDLGFKEGQTITINMNISKKSSKPRPKSTSAGFSGTPGLLPPPPGGVKLPPPSASKTATQSHPAKPANGASSTPSVTNDLLDLGSLSLSSGEPALNPAPAPQNSSSNELWGDFTTAGNLDSEKKTTVNSDDWINF